MLKASSPGLSSVLRTTKFNSSTINCKSKPSDVIQTSQQKFGQSQYVGALFESQNAITWTADQTKNLMFVIDRCVFDTTQNPVYSIQFTKGLPYRKIGTNDIQHLLDANNVSNLYGNYSNDTWSDAVNLTTTDFTPAGTGINYNYYATSLMEMFRVRPYQASLVN
jgi:hypothetical protein